MGNCCTSGSVDEQEQLVLDGVKRFTLDELKLATNEFSQSVGIGNFGHVYRGWVDEQTLAPVATGSGMAVAVKKFVHRNPEGRGPPPCPAHWLVERRHLAQLRHPNIIRLFGYCCDPGVYMLVFNYMPNGDMEKLLFPDHDRLAWRLRFRALLGVAKGLAYLHNQSPKVIYRDFKPANILVDQDYNGVLADFGIARDGPTGDRSHVSTESTGTFGYICPCYIDTNHLSTKADVYSFGVVLLEVLSGRASVDPRRPFEEQYLVMWALSDIQEGRFPDGFLDPEIVDCPMDTLVRLRELAAHCLEYLPVDRPSMDEIVSEFQNIL